MLHTSWNLNLKNINIIIVIIINNIIIVVVMWSWCTVEYDDNNDQFNIIPANHLILSAQSWFLTFKTSKSLDVPI